MSRLPVYLTGLKKWKSRLFAKKFSTMLVFAALLLPVLFDLTTKRLALPLKGIAIGLIVFCLFAVLIRTISLVHGMIMIRKRFGVFAADKATEIMDQCQPLHRTFAKKKDHVVILLHGFISTPMVFDNILKELEEGGVDYHAPLINGFGIKRIQLIFSFSEHDWIRQVTELYDVLDSQYEHISIIGHSMGGALAMYLSQVRPVKHLILFAPALFPGDTQKIHNFLARSRVLNTVVPWIVPLMPVLEKMRDDFDEDVSTKYNLYPVAPTRGAFNLLRMQSRIKMDKLQYQTLDLLYGVNDTAVDGEKVREYFDSARKFHRVHRFDHTGHNPLIDSESDFASLIIGLILAEQLSWPPENQLSWNR